MTLAASYEEGPAGILPVQVPEIKRKPSTKFNLYPARTPIPNSTVYGLANGRSNDTMQLAPAISYALPPRPKTGNSQHSQHSYQSATSEPYQPYTPQKRPSQTLRKQYSEASRLRALNNGFIFPAEGRHTPDRGRQTPDRGRHTPDMGRLTPDAGRQTPDRTPPVVENFSRPRKTSNGRNNLSPEPLQQTSTSPLAASNESKLNISHGTQASRDRGYSTASSQSNMIHPPVVQVPPGLRSSSSIPDYNSAGPTYSRHRNVNNSHYQPERGPSRLDGSGLDSNYSINRQERRADTLSDEEVRTSFRSALTTNSSVVASGTERSSILTKSSSATSFFPQEDELEGDDDGMSVDDAIGMYEDGFDDSAPEENADDDMGETYDERPRTADSGQSTDLRPRTGSSEKRRSVQIAEAMNDSLAPPAPAEVRDSLAFFGGNMTEFIKPPMQHTKSGLSTRTAASMAKSYDGADETPRETSITETLAISGKNPTIPPPYGEARDRYGFKKASIHISAAQYDAWNGPYTEYLIRRRKKWVGLMQESKLMTDKPIRFPPKSAKVKRFVRKGIPPDWRGAAWFYYAGGPAELAKHDGLYKQLLDVRANGALSETDEELIERDLHRTFPDNIKFKLDTQDVPGETDSGRTASEPDTPTLHALRRVLQAFSILNPKIGYCQSLNFLAGLLLLFMEEEKAFWMLNIITRHLPGTHEVNLEGANVDLGVLMSSIKESMPGIWAKINGDLDGEKASKSGGASMRLPPITLCTTAWFMSCFIGTLPIETTLRVWDSFFYEGSKTLFRIALAIFKTGEQEIKAVSDPMEIFQVVQTIPRRLVDANALLEMTFERWNGFRHLSQEEIEKRRKERREGYAEERRIAAGGGETSQRRGLFGRRKKTGLIL